MTAGPSDGAPSAHGLSEAVRSTVPLTRVMADAPAAVLLVDLAAGEVVYANDLARQFAPDVTLPVDVASWSSRAALHDADGAELEATSTPLARVAEGEPVNGELVTAMRRSDVSAAREDLWVIGTPLSDAPAPLGRRALVVFLPLRETEAIARAAQRPGDLRHRAVLASETSFSISDPSSDDNPLVWVNPAFERTTGYSSADVIGKNCRFLQGPLTDPTTVQRISAGLADGGLVDETLLNYRADGTAFWNHLVISPVFDSNGTVTHHVGVQTDVSERVDADLARDAALGRAEAISRQQRAVSAIGAAFAERLGRPERFPEQVAELISAHVAGLCAVALLDDQQVGQLAIARDVETLNTFYRSDEHVAVAEFLRADRHGLVAAAREPATRWPVIVDAQELAPAGTAADEPNHTIKAVVAPLMVRGHVAGLLLIVRPAEQLDDFDEISAITDIALRAGVALDNVRMFAEQRDAALTLQRSLMPALPEIPRFDIAATYIPAADAEVGGDWFDVLELPGPWLGVTMGDVVGHDMKAAAVMGQLRSTVRTLAWEGHLPGEVIGRADALVRATATTSFATVFYARVDCPEEDSPDAACRVTYTSAGHPPALLRHADGRVEYLDAATTSPVGVSDEREVPTASTEIPVGGTLVCYTDGLVERHAGDIEDAIRLLERLLGDIDPDASAQSTRDTVTDALIDVDHPDDTCILVLRRRF